MRSNTFNYSLLAIGVAAVLGMSTTANAAETPITTTGIDITNQASASYNVSGQEQPVVQSNIVKITVSQQVSFSLTANNDDTEQGGDKDDDKNESVEVAPNGFVLFEHTLKNTGNLTDTYTITLGATDSKYDQGNSTVSFIVYEADGVTEVRDGTVAYTEGASIPSVLEKEQSVKFTIRAKTLGNKGNETLPLILSVKSAYLSAPGSNATTDTLTNSNTSFTRLPTFGIIKTITNGLDLNNLADTAEYKVVVTNESTDFSTDATAVDIADFLPTGLVLSEPLTATNITASSTATVGTIATGATGDSGFNVTGNTIPVGQSITIIFKVIQGGSGTLDPATAINHVTVTDDLDNDTATDNTLVDSTDTGRELLVSNFYPTAEINNLNGQTPANTGDDSTLPLSLGGTIQRALTLTGPTFREIAPTSGTAGQVTHATVITNTGKDVEGSNAGELTFTITDNDGGARDAINIEPGSVTVTYDADGVGAGAAGSAIPIGFTTVNGVNIYDINSALSAGIAPTGTVTINYKVSSVKAPLYSPSNTTDPTFENTIVTLIPKLEGAPVPTAVTDKTTVRGLTLLKTQAIDADCTGTPAAGEFVSTPLTNALPGQCIVYKIQAKNTSSTLASASPTGVGFDITDIIISDEFSKFSANADYVAGSVETSSGTTDDTGLAITNNIATLAPQETATMQFKVKIKTSL